MDKEEEVRVRTTAKAWEREREWEGDIKHEGANWANSPAHSFSFCLLPFLPPSIYLSFLFSFSLCHLFLSSPPTPLISSKSFYISSVPPLRPLHSPKKKKKKMGLTLMNRWREEGSDRLRGVQEKLDQHFLVHRLFTQDSPMWSCQSLFLPFVFSFYGQSY